MYKTYLYIYIHVYMYTTTTTTNNNNNTLGAKQRDPTPSNHVLNRMYQMQPLTKYTHEITRETYIIHRSLNL